MKILVMITRRNNSILRITETLQRMGHDVKAIYVDHFQSCHSYLAKKLDKLGFSAARMKYEYGLYEQAVTAVREWQAKRILFVNFGFQPDLRADFVALCKEKECLRVSWLVDPADVDNPDNRAIYGFYDKAYFYELYDAEYIARKFQVNALYCPVGYNADYAIDNYSGAGYKRDIVFLGSPYKERMDLLNKLAKTAEERDWIMEVYGPFYDDSRYFWKKYKRKIKYPYLYKCVHNGIFYPCEIAKLYRESKICLNMHVTGARGMNPRCYEIMATGSFQLLDVRHEYCDYVPGRDFDVYDGFELLVKKIEYYLQHDDERQAIARQGHCTVQKHSMERCMQMMLDI